ncbi:MAG TPA: hypothetical protein VJ841_03535 [Candidatus Saccharimonadales bacterium]|nr:hypothetical protein [Candidatus Saccharimonadales bacterium]
MKKTVGITTESPAWQNAFDHANGDADQAIGEVFYFLIARYEQNIQALGWGERAKAYARNALRKTLLEDYDKWKNGEIKELV